MERLFGRKNGRQLWAPTPDPRLETSVLAHVCYATKERKGVRAVWLSTFPMSLGLWDLLQIAPAQGMLAVPRWNPHAYQMKKWELVLLQNSPDCPDLRHLVVDSLTFLSLAQHLCSLPQRSFLHIPVHTA